MDATFCQVLSYWLTTVWSRVISSTSIEAQLPGFQEPGVYGVSVRNQEGATSLPHSLWVNSTPEIDSVEQGADFVNYYEVIIHGKNFLFNSTLVVKEPEDSALGQTYQQLSSVSPKSAASQVSISPQGDRLIYVDCQTLIYHRYRTSRAKDLRLQIFNTDGRKTDLYYYCPCITRKTTKEQTLVAIVLRAE